MTALFRNRIFWTTIVGLFSLGGLVPGVYAQDSPGTPQISAGDTAWVLTSSALVLAMVIPGLALFYGGMVRSKNVLSTIMHSFIAVCVVSIVWVFWGYSLAFAPDVGGVVGGLQWLGLTGVGPEPVEGSTIPHSVFMVFQLMFAAITVALISGAIAERVKFSAFVLFAILWVTLIYSPLCHWA